MAKAIIAFSGYAALFYIIYSIKEFKKIKFTLKLIQEMTVPIRKLKMLFFPLVVSLLQLLTLAGFFYIWFIFMSSGYAANVAAGDEFGTSEVRAVNTRLYAFYGCIAVLLCGASYLGFFTTLQRFVICSQVGQWYFSKSKLFLSGTLCKSLKASQNHYGTFFYYSMLIMAIWPLRSMAAFIKRRFNRIEYANKFNLMIVKSFKPLLYFYETRWKYFNSDTIIQIALFGDNFNLAGIRLYYLKYRNFSRMSPFMNIYGYFTIQGKLLVSTLSAAFIYFYMTFAETTILGVDIEVVQVPALVPMLAFLGSMIVSQNFTNLIDLSIQTLVICFIADEEMFTGQQRYAEPLFRKFFDELGQEADRREYQKVAAKKSEYSVGGIGGASKRPLRPRAFDNEDADSKRVGDPTAKFEGQDLAQFLDEDGNPTKRPRPPGEEEEGESSKPNKGIENEDDGLNNRFFYNRPPTPPPPPEEKSSYEEVSDSEEEEVVAPVNVTKRERDFFNFSAEISQSEIKQPVIKVEPPKQVQGWNTSASVQSGKTNEKKPNQLGFTTNLDFKKTLDINNSRDNMGRFDNNVSQEVSKLDNQKASSSNKFKGIMDDDDDDSYSYEY